MKHSFQLLEESDKLIFQLGQVTLPTTKAHRESFKIAEESFGQIINKLSRIASNDIGKLEKALENADAPYTPGRVLQWIKD